MLYFIWSILNILCISYFIYVVFGFLVKPKKLAQSKYKLGFIIIVLISIAASSEKETNKKVITDKNIVRDHAKSVRLILEDNLTFNINTSITYGIDSNGYIPTSANSGLTGFVSGYEWQLKSVIVRNNTPNYEIDGVLQWQLFGIKFYSQSKRFKGNLLSY